MFIDTNISNTLHRLHNGEHFGFGEEVVEKIKPDAESLPAAKADWDNYEAAVSHESVMYRQSAESPETKDIAEFDTQRDRYWGEMLHKLKFEEKNLDENVRKAAKELLFIMKKYGNVSKSNLFEETIDMRKVLNELKQAENSAAVALINGFGELILATETLNDNLHGLYDQRRIEKEKVKGLGKLVDYRKTVDKLFIRFLETINAIERMNSVGTKDPAIKAAVENIKLQLDSLISQLQLILDRRKGGHHQKPDITNPEVPGEGGDGEDGGGDGEGGDGGDGGGDGGDGGDGGYQIPDITNPPPFGE